MKTSHLLYVFLLMCAAECFSQTTGSSNASTLPKDGFVYANGVKLHYVDWGGDGEPLLLLAGLGNDAHVFDDFARRLTDRFRVFALTRRGFGKSDVPQEGYDTETRAEDIRHFLGSLNVSRTNLAGHSMAGSEMTLFASMYPERVERLVYLDAAYDHTCSAGRSLEPWASTFARQLYAELENPATVSEIAASDLPPRDRWEAIKATARAVDSKRPNYSKIRAPALALYAPPDRYPDAPRGTPPDQRRAMDEWWRENRQDCVFKSIEQFRTEMRHGQTAVIQNGYHYLFLGIAQGEVIKRMRAFLLEPIE